MSYSMKPKPRDDWDQLVLRCRKCGLPKPEMSPAHLTNSELMIEIPGVHRWHGTMEQCIAMTDRFVSGYEYAKQEKQQ